MIQLWVTDRWENYKGAATGITKCLSKRKVNGDESLTFRCDQQWEKGDRVVWRDLMGRWHENIIDGVEEKRGNDGITYEYYAPSSAKIELTGDYLEDKRPYQSSAFTALSSALSESRWEVGQVDSLGTKSTNFYHVDAWSAIHTVADTWEGELEYEITVTGSRITARKVNLKTRVGGDYGRRFTYTKDLVSVERTVDEGNVVTALYGYGAALPTTDESGELTGGYTRKLTFGSVNGGKNWVGDDDALELWGRPDASGKKHVFGQVEFSNCDDPSELLELTKAELKKRCVPNVVYKADVVTLQRAGEGFDGADAGDTVTVVDEVFNPHLTIQARVTEVQEDQLNAENTTYTFGVWQDLASKISSQQSAINSLQSGVAGWDSAANQTKAYIDAIIANVNEAVNALGGWTYIEPGNGIITYDKPKNQNPTMAIQLLGGALRISDEKNSDGTWNWKTFGTGAGFFADLIVAGVLNAGIIRAGVLEDKEGKNYWNLETGEFRLSSSTSIGDSHIANASETISKVRVEFASGSSSTTAPTSGWSTENPKWDDSRYIWQRIVTTMQDGTEDIDNPVCIQGAMGTPGNDGTGVSKLVPQYYLSISKTALGGGSWSTQEPEWQKGRYIWERTQITWSDGSVTYTDPVLLNAVNGANEAVSNLDESLNQQGVFDRLTNKGKAQGIFLENGQLYINGEYVQTSTLRVSEIFAKNGRNNKVIVEDDGTGIKMIFDAQDFDWSIYPFIKSASHSLVIASGNSGDSNRFELTDYAAIVAGGSTDQFGERIELWVDKNDVQVINFKDNNTTEVPFAIFTDAGYIKVKNASFHDDMAMIDGYLISDSASANTFSCDSIRQTSDGSATFGSVSALGNVSVDGDLTARRDVNIYGNVKISGTLTVNGKQIA